MNWMEILQQIFELCIVPLIGIASTMLIKLINEKSKEIVGAQKNEKAKKYITLLSQTVAECVIATNQVYVEALKGKDAFTPEAQKEAFARTYESIMAILTEEARSYLAEVYGDLDQYITTKIEAEVNAYKQAEL